MSTTTNQNFNQATVTITNLTSLTNYNSAEGTLVDNTSNKYIDYTGSGTVKMGSGVSTGDLHVLASANDGNNTTTPATGSDNTIVVPDISNLGGLRVGDEVPGTNLRYWGRINARGQAANAVVKFFMRARLSDVFGGTAPQKAAPVVVNCSGQTLGSSNCAFYMTGIDYVSA